MRGRIIPNLSIAPSRELGPERAEPRLLPANAPLPFRRPATATPGILSATREDEPKPPMSPALSVADRRPAPATARPRRALAYFAVAGLIAIAVSAAAGVGFVRFTAPSKETVAAVGRDAAEPPQADRQPWPISPEATTPHLAAPAAIPSPPLAQQAAAANVEPKSQGNAARALLPTLPSSAAPASAAPVSRRAASPATARAAAATSVAARPPPAAGDSPPDHPAAPRPIGNHRPAHARTAERRIHSRSPSEVRSPEPRSRPAHSSTLPQSDQAASFDRLVTRLTAPTTAVDQVLTPPAPGAADPFAQPPQDGKSAQ
jgi:hypothetical protein